MKKKEFPTQKVIYKKRKIGQWFHSQKGKINTTDDTIYKELSQNDLIKNEIDRYLDTKNNKPDIKRLDFEEGLRLLFQYCNEKDKVPTAKTKYKNHNIGNWYHNFKGKNINDINSDYYKKLSENKLVKRDLNRYLNSDRSTKLTYDEKLELLFKYCNEKKKVPVSTTKYPEFGIGNYYVRLRAKIKSKNDKEYLDLIKNEYIKDDINNFLGKKLKYN